MTAASISLQHLRLQPPSPTVAAPITYGCSLHHLRLQAWIGLPKVERVASTDGSNDVVKAQWMEVRVEV